MKIDVPFEIQYGDFADEDYAALDRYYCKPASERDPKEISYIKYKYDFLRSDSEEDSKREE